ncbi:MAG: 2-hydroxychromene-2-carboxylate isomerase [Rhodospirillaceae bacterium]|nr:2-hydroxychromene-2-carboxylate isomerase [Rhodospirillaceae bacterium]
MAAPILFFFDFTSTFSYIAVQKIDDLAARYGRAVDWSAVSLGHLFQAQGVTPPPNIPAKHKYLAIDFARSCEFAGLPHGLPDPLPPDVKLARYAFWRFKAQDEALAHAFARAAMSALFGRGQRVATAGEIFAACAAVPGVSEPDIEAAATDMAAKRAVIAAVETAKAVGMNGAPYMVLDGEPFWGADRLDQLERRLGEKH